MMSCSTSMWNMGNVYFVIFFFLEMPFLHIQVLVEVNLGGHGRIIDMELFVWRFTYAYIRQEK